MSVSIQEFTKRFSSAFNTGLFLGLCIGCAGAMMFQSVSTAKQMSDCRQLGTEVDSYLVSNRNSQGKASASMAYAWAPRGMGQGDLIADKTLICHPYISEQQFKTLARAAKILQGRE